MKKSVFICFVLCSLVGGTSAQPKALTIGDPVPDFAFRVLNYDQDSVRLSDFRGKLLILDFWSTWCSTCIEQFPKLSRLQEQFRDELVILPLGLFRRDDREIIRFYWEKIAANSNVRLPTALYNPADTSFRHYLPNSALPHLVWIDREGKVAAITDHRAVTETNLRGQLDGTLPSMTEKRLLRILWEDDPFLINRAFWEKGLTASAFAGYQDTLAQMDNPQLSNRHKYQRFFCVNLPVERLYRAAYHGRYGEGALFSRDRIKKGSRFQYKNYSDVTYHNNWQMDTFNRTQLFCYERIMPAQVYREHFFDAVIRDLDQYFGVKSAVVKQDTTGMVLLRLPGSQWQ